MNVEFCNRSLCETGHLRAAACQLQSPMSRLQIVDMIAESRCICQRLGERSSATLRRLERSSHDDYCTTVADIVIIRRVSNDDVAFFDDRSRGMTSRDSSSHLISRQWMHADRARSR